MTVNTIPKTFGSGGSGLNPTADPTNNLQKILSDHVAAINSSIASITAINAQLATPAGADWFALMGAIFQAKTGLASSQWVIETTETFVRYNNGYSADVIATGTGATALPDPTYGSSLVLKAPTVGNSGSAKWFPGAATTILGQEASQGVKDPIIDARQKRWMVAFAMGPTTPTQPAFTSNPFVAGLSFAGDTHTAGLGYSGSTNLQAVQDGAVVAGAASDLGISIGQLGIYGSGYVANFNMSQWVVNINPGVVADVIAGNTATLPAGGARPCLELTGSNTVQQTLSFDHVFFCREL